MWNVYRYPLKEASSIAISVIKEFSDDFREVFSATRIFLLLFCHQILGTISNRKLIQKNIVIYLLHNIPAIDSIEMSLYSIHLNDCIHPCISWMNRFTLFFSRTISTEYGLRVLPS